MAKRKISAPPAWLVLGSIVDYSSVIGEPPTECAMVVRDGPAQMPSGHWVVWLTGKAGCVSVDACRPAAANDAPAEVQMEILAAEVGQNPVVWQRFVDLDPCIEADLGRIGANRTLGLGSLSPDAGHAYLDPPPRWTPGEVRDYWSGWIALEMATHDDRDTRDADGWGWHIDRPIAEQDEPWMRPNDHDLRDAFEAAIKGTKGEN